MTDCSQSGSGSYGFYIHDSVTGVFTASGLYATGNTGIDYYFKNLTLDATSSISSSESYNSTYWKIDNVTNLILSSCIVDGFQRAMQGSTY